MKKLIFILNKLLLISMLAIGYLSYPVQCAANDYNEYREVMDYSHHAKMDRLEARDRYIELQQHQQQEYTQQQQSMYRQDLYNQAHQRRQATTVQFSSELSDQ
jgi:hypothetical protein